MKLNLLQKKRAKPGQIPASTPVSTTRGLSIDDVASRLGLAPSRAESLRKGERFIGPSGLACFLEVETRDGVDHAARPSVLLGVSAHELAGEEVRVLMELQLSLISSGLWLLGVSAEGELLVTSIPSMRNASELAAALDLAQLTASAALHRLLDTMNEFGGEASAGDTE